MPDRCTPTSKATLMVESWCTTSYRASVVCQLEQAPCDLTSTILVKGCLSAYQGRYGWVQSQQVWSKLSYFSCHLFDWMQRQSSWVCETANMLQTFVWHPLWLIFMTHHYLISTSSVSRKGYFYGESPSTSSVCHRPWHYGRKHSSLNVAIC
jgi:hypothetical protein